MEKEYALDKSDIATIVLVSIISGAVGVVVFLKLEGLI